jgi:hypothetical protein
MTTAIVYLHELRFSTDHCCSLSSPPRINLLEVVHRAEARVGAVGPSGWQARENGARRDAASPAVWE